MKKIHLIIIFIIIISFQEILSENDNTDGIDYLKLALRIFESLETKCFPDINRTINERMKFEKDKRYPWITDTMGKGINDIGDEIECLNSLKNTTFFIVNFYQLNLSQILDNDQKLMDFLEIKNFTLGFCLMHSCSEAFTRYLAIIAEFVNFIASNKDAPNNLVQFFEDNKIDSGPKNLNNLINLKTSEIKKVVLIILGVLFGIKLIGGIVRIIFIPKGYDKYVAEKINEINNDERKESDSDEKLNLTDLTKKHKFNEPLNEESSTKEYNPLFDFSEKLPLWIRILRGFDLINDIQYLSSKRNRYFNDTGLDIIIFNRAIVIFNLIFSNTFSALIALPSEEIINSSFFQSGLNIFYRLSNNSLECWAFLEGAYTTYKLLCFITAEMFVYIAQKDKKKKYQQLLIICCKFLILLIPKILIFFAIFYIVYFRVEDFRFLFSAKATFQHIITNIFKHNIHCDENANIFKNSFYLNIDDYNRCYEFVYFYLNMICCILIFVIITYLFFVIKNKIFEIIVISLNLIYFICSFLLIEDNRVDSNIKEPLLLHYHIIGQTYSTKIFQSFIGFYHLGFIVGYLIFNFDSIKPKLNRLIYEYNGIHLLNQDNKKDQEKGVMPFEDQEEQEEQENENTSISEKSKESKGQSSFDDEILSEDSSNYYKNFVLSYYPLKYLNKVLNSIDKLSFTSKILFILLGFLLLIGLDYILLIYVMITDEFRIDLSDGIKFLFKFEKHLFIIIYFFMIVLMITLPKKGAIRNLMNSRIIISISRIGFFITCVSYAFTYFSFLIFSLKIKLYVPTFVIISFGNFLLFFIVCIILCAICELPLRFLIKKLLRINRKKESIIL